MRPNATINCLNATTSARHARVQKKRVLQRRQCRHGKGQKNITSDQARKHQRKPKHNLPELFGQGLDPVC